MDDLRNRLNFFASLHTSLSQRQIAQLFTPLGWAVRKCSWTDYEVRRPFVELMIEAENPILLHGRVADVEANVDHILAPLRRAWVGYSGECCNGEGSLLRDFCWGNAEPGL